MLYDTNEQVHRDDLARAVKATKKTSRKKTVIEAAREITEAKQAKRFRGVLFDGYTASAIVTVYDAINEENKAKFDSMDKGDKTSIVVMANVAFRMLKK